MKKVLFKTSLICMAAFIGASVFADADPSGGAINPYNAGGYDPGAVDSSNFIQTQKYREKVKYEETKDPAIIQEEIRQKMDLLNTEQVSFKLKKINITGNTVFPTYVLMRLVDFKIGQQVTINDLIASANEITDYYQNKGYISTIAYLPPQKVQNGEVNIIILEGKYGLVNVNNGKWERKSYLAKRYLSENNIETGKILNVKDVRNALADITAEEYMKGSVSFSDNEDSEEFSDITLDIKDRFPINLDLRYDNQGREAIGTQRGVIYAGLHDVTGNGDTLMGTLAASKYSLGVGGMYSLPIAKNDTRLNLGYSYSKVALRHPAIRHLGLRGESNDYFIGVSRRLAHGEGYRLYGDVTFDWRDTESSSKIPELNYHSRYRSRVIRGTLTDIKDDQYGRWLFNAAVSGGVPIDASDYNKDRSMGSNNFVKVNTNLARLQVLPANQLLIMQVSTQYANRHMYASEALQVGGINSVRGFDEGFRIGDYGVVANVEYRFPIPGLKRLLPEKYGFVSDSIQLAGFYDFGWYGDRFTNHNLKNEREGDYIMSAGPGIVVKLTKYISANLYWGFPIGKRMDDFKNDKASRYRFHFTVTSNIL